MKQENLNYILIFLFIITVMLLFANYTIWKKDGTKCLINPLVYGVNEWERINNEEFFCSCYFVSNPEFKVEVNNKNITIKEVSKW